MGILQKNPFSQDVGKQLYSFGHNRSLLIVGLGNVGKQYSNTRHNLGFMCVDYFAESNDFPSWIEKKDAKAYMTKKILGETNVILVKPATMMNLSGEAVQAIAHFYKISTENIIAVYDELAIPFGQIRTRSGGSAAGHNGIKNMISHLGEQFGRIRIGINNDQRPVQMDNADYVLGVLSAHEKEQLPALQKEVASILTETIFGSQLQAETRSFIL